MRERFRIISRKKGVLHSVLSAIVVAIMIVRFLHKDYYSVFLCALNLVLFYIPAFVNRTFKVKLTRELHVIILLFIFSGGILGELASFYTYIPWWDTMLHTINGFLMAAIGFAMIDILNNSPKFHISLSPVFVAFVAFCFSMTIGVLWEFFEFGMDALTTTDMQKDRIITEISSVNFNGSGVNSPVTIKDIQSTAIYYAGSSEPYIVEGGYLDVGIIDTMKDLLVNLIGAVVFSVIGYFYIIGRSKGYFASKFIPQMKTPEEVRDTEKEIEREKRVINGLRERKKRKKEKKKQAEKVE